MEWAVSKGLGKRARAEGEGDERKDGTLYRGSMCNVSMEHREELI